eukprot:4527656-Pyramimonas_sp.AAC.1
MFVLYLAVGIFLLTNILLAVVLAAYKEQLAKGGAERTQRLSGPRLLTGGQPTRRPPRGTRASCVRLVHHENIPTRPASDRYVVRIYPYTGAGAQREQVRRLIQALRRYVAVPNWLVEGGDFDEFFDTLDADGSNTVSLQEFKQVIDVLRLHFGERPTSPLSRTLSRWWVYTASPPVIGSHVGIYRRPSCDWFSRWVPRGGPGGRLPAAAGAVGAK